MALTGAHARLQAPPGAAKGARWSALWFLGMLVLFVGERLIGGAATSRSVCLVLGFLAIVGAMLGRLGRLRAFRATSPDRADAEKLILRLYGAGVLAVILYCIQSDLPTLRGHLPLEHGSPKLATTLGALWPALWIAAAWPVALVELAYAQLAKAPRIETGRIRDAMYSGLGLAGALVFVFTITYVSSDRDKKVDLAYFRTSRPGEVVKRIIRTLDQPLEIASFFPDGNEVREEVDGYLKDLAKESGQLTVTHYDYDIDPIKAKEYGVSSNGTLAFVRGKRHELLGLPVQFEAARNALKTLDKEVQQRLMLIARQNRSVFFTVGHGERTWNPPVDSTDKRSGLGKLRELLLDQSLDLREYGASDGLIQDVPMDATALAIIGPTRPFSADESAAVNRYVDKGGRLLVALDPGNGVNLKEILDPLQLEFHDVTLANDQVFARKTHTDGDRVNLVTSSFSAHPAVTTLARVGQRAPVVLAGAGWIDAKRGRPIQIQVDSPIKAHYSTWEDKNHNFKNDPDEPRRAWELAAASVKGNSRNFVIADSDCFSDDVINVAGNELLALDVMHWLMGDEAYSGLSSTEVDLPVTHTRKEDIAWFYSTIFLAPVLVLVIGWLVTKRRRRAENEPRQAPTEGAPATGGAP
ncbi:MAG TPA: Gldg family protein [Polyangia bacterium]|nr:Gldg family protein [Polyangia bacterium]